MRRQHRFLSGEVHKRNRAAVVEQDRMVDERDAISPRREARVPDPTRRLVQNLARRELEPTLVRDDAHDQEVLSVGRPVGIVDLLEQLARSTSGRAHSGERAGAREGRVEVGLEEDRHLARRGHRGDVGVRHSEDRRLRAFRPADVDLGGLPVPGRRRQDALAVGAKPRAPDRALPERELLEHRRRGHALRLAGEISGGERRERDQRGGEERDPTESNSSSPSRRGRRARRRGARKRFQIEREVVGRVEALLGTLLEAVAHDALEPRLDVLVRGRKIRRLLAEDRRHRLGSGFAVKRARARQHLVEDGAERKDVRACVGRLSLHLLRGHVAERPHHDAGLGAAAGRGRQVRLRPGGAVRLRQLGETEVEDLDPSVVGDEQVLGFQIPMHDPLLVRRRQALCRLDRIFGGLAHREPAPEAARAASRPRGAPSRCRAILRASRARRPR